MGYYDTRKAKPIKCNCNQCFHSIKKNGVRYCKYYDIINPKKSKCARYYKY